jgi:hypothetical protein
MSGLISYNVMSRGLISESTRSHTLASMHRVCTPSKSEHKHFSNDKDQGSYFSPHSVNCNFRRQSLVTQEIMRGEGGKTLKFDIDISFKARNIVARVLCEQTKTANANISELIMNKIKIILINASELSNFKSKSHTMTSMVEIGISSAI